MSNADFANEVYRNILGRSSGANTAGLNYWSGALSNSSETRGSLIKTILASAHSFKGDATWGWVPDLLNNKIAAGKTFAVDYGLTYNSPSDSISHGMNITQAVTATDTSADLHLIGISDAPLPA